MSKEQNILRHIIREQCAGHYSEQNGISNFCVEVDRTCLYFGEADTLPRCKYLETAVLSAEVNKPAQAMYWAIQEAQGAGDSLSPAKVKTILRRENNTVQCDKCKEPFLPANNRQRYCDKCKKLVQRDQARMRKQSQRKTG